MKICSKCQFETDKNKCLSGHIRWRDGLTLEIKTVVNCPNFKKRNGGKPNGTTLNGRDDMERVAHESGVYIVPTIGGKLTYDPDKIV